MPNLLELENSPYLLQHKNNPVNWYPWGSEALERARSENKPIFLSVGYAACHWCHVMEKESFEDSDTARLMNEHFINIKVDREERPDIDSLYMNAVVAMTGQGGWPMSVFLTPAGEPFFGGTYFPPVRRYNMPAFREVLISVASVWDEKPEQILDSSSRITEHLRQATSLQTLDSTAPLNENMVQTAVKNLIDSYDTEYGGWGAAPKFPQPMVIEFLIQQMTKPDYDPDIEPTIRHVLDKMALGGMYDVIGGGFARYSTDNHWLVPHFEKMLYDNAQLSQVYLYAYLLTGDPAYRRVCEQTLEFIKRELLDDSGGFYSSLDADSEGEEGKFYVWSRDEIATILSDQNDYEFFVSAYGVSESGNFEGNTVLQRQKSDSQMAALFNIDIEDVPNWLSSCHQRLLAYRSRRTRPGTDDKILVSWNSLTMISFAEAARYLGSESYLETAQKNAQFILSNMHDENRLYRSWRLGKIRHNAYLEDYGALILGLLSLYQTDFDPNWYQHARRITEEMTANFLDRDGALHDTRNDHEELFIRPKNLQDNATPSGSALASLALLKMAALSGKGAWRDLAEREMGNIHEVAVSHPTAFGKWLCAVDFAVSPTNEIAVLGDPAVENTDDLIKIFNSKFRPYSVVAASPFPPGEDTPPLLHNRPLVDGKPSVYVCHNFICKLPVTDPQVFAAEIG